MPDTPTIRTRTELLKEAKEYQNRMKAAGDITTSDQAVPEKDPNEKGQAAIKSHPDGDDATKLQVPSDSRPSNTQEQDDGVSTQNPGPSGTDPVSTADGDAQDAAFNSPTDKIASAELKKIAAATQPIFERIANYSAELSGTKKAAAPAPARAPATQANSLGDLHVKIASALLSTEKGVALVEDYLAEHDGVKAAQAMIEKASVDQYEFLKIAAEAQQYAAAQQNEFLLQVREVENIYKSASADDQTRLVKLANAHAVELAKLDPALHEYYKAGAADAAMVVSAMMAGEEPGVPGGAGDLAPEQLLGLIEQLVQSGQLDPALAEQLVQALLGAGGAPAEGGAPVEGGEMPPEAMLEAGGAPPEGDPAAMAAAAEGGDEELDKAANWADAFISGVAA